MPEHTVSSIETTFPNADLVLILPSSRYFSVNRNLLSSKSGVFSDLLETATESEAAIELQDDEDAFLVFMHTLHGYDIDHFFPKNSRRTTNLVSHVLDLYDKYQVDQEDIRPKLISFIERDWPETLSEWDANEAEIQKMHIELKIKLDSEGTYLGDELDTKLPEPATAIRFAYIYAPSEQQIQMYPKYITAAFYHLSRIPPNADPDDPTFGEGFYYENEGLRSAKKSLLRKQDLINLSHGIHELRNEMAAIAFTEFPKEAKSADFPADEVEAMLDWWAKFGLVKLLGPNERPDPLQRLKEIMDLLDLDVSDDHRDSQELHRKTSLAYRKRMHSYLSSTRADIWNGLSNYFSLYSFFYND